MGLVKMVSSKTIISEGSKLITGLIIKMINITDRAYKDLNKIIIIPSK
mgnify:CR=1 FL=1